MQAPPAPSLPTHTSLSTQLLPEFLVSWFQRSHILTSSVPPPTATCCDNHKFLDAHFRLATSCHSVCSCRSLPLIPCPQQFCGQQLIYPIAFLYSFILIISCSPAPQFGFQLHLTTTHSSLSIPYLANLDAGCTSDFHLPVPSRHS